MKKLLIILSLFASVSLSATNQIAESQEKWIRKYKKQPNIPAPAEMLLNTEEEPELTDGFTDLYNGKDLDNWTSIGGNAPFEPTGEAIVGTSVKGTPSTYLSTIKDDYTDFIFTAEIKWEVDGNTGIIFRGREGKNDKSKKYPITAIGPQAEMEEASKERYWSGGIYGQGCGGWIYPLWLDAHEAPRNAIDRSDWNRITIKAVGTNVKTWINGVPAAHWETEEHLEGFFSLQIHAGKKGTVHFRNIKVKELSSETGFNDLFKSGDFENWTQLNGNPVPAAWSIENGVIHRGGIRPGSIITKKEYKDFQLRFDWKISEKGNSGIKYRTRKKLGLEYQLLDDARHRNGKHPLTTAASIYGLFPASKDKLLHSPGEWNHGQIIAKGNHVQHWLNGDQVLEAVIGSEAWNQQLEQSKFKELADFGSLAGPILLQDHMDKVWFRNVQIREL